MFPLLSAQYKDLKEVGSGPAQHGPRAGDSSKRLNPDLLIAEMKSLSRRQGYIKDYIDYLETLLGMDKIEYIIKKIGKFKYEDEQHMGWEEWLSRETKSVLRVSRIEKVNIHAKSELLKIDLFQNYVYLEHLLFYHTTIKAFPILRLDTLERQRIETLNLNYKVLNLNNSILYILLNAGKVS